MVDSRKIKIALLGVFCGIFGAFLVVVGRYAEVGLLGLVLWFVVRGEEWGYVVVAVMIGAARYYFYEEGVEEGGWFFQKMDGVKGLVVARLENLYTEPYSGFMAGLLLGERSSMSQELLGKFNATGLTHIIAISGYNITIVILFFTTILKFLRRQIRILVSLVFIFIFVVLVGASASVVRAGIMGSIGLMALLFGRQYDTILSLLWAGVLMCMFDPTTLVNDLGFQLSFLATLGIIVFSDRLGRVLEKVPNFLAMRDSLVLTLSAQVFVIPIIIYNFDRMSLISPFANVVILPFIPLAMLMGFLSILFGRIFAFAGYVVLKLVIFLTEIAALVPFASVDFTIGRWFVWGYYVLLGWWLFRVDR